MLRPDHVDRHAVVLGRRAVSGRADAGGAPQFLHRVSGPCTIDEAAGKVTLKVDAAWRPDYVGTEQVRFFRFDNGRLIFGPAPGSIRAGDERLSRRLTLERVH